MLNWKYILRIIDENFDLIKKEFEVSGGVKNITEEQGDRHCGNKAVAIVEFERGKIVYKPRSMEIDKKFYAFLEEVNDLLKIDSPLMPKIVDFGSFSLQEFVETEPCQKKSEVDEFYFRMGVCSCLFYLLSTTDLHMENIIAKKNSPYFVDLETMFQICNVMEEKTESVQDVIMNKIKSSILSTQLFPNAENIREKIDFSGITGFNGQIIMKNGFEIVNKDEIKRMQIREVIDTGKNIPMINEYEVYPRDYTQKILEGFRKCYMYILSNKQKFIGDDGLLRKFKGCKVRAIFRDTSAYYLLINRLSSPLFKNNKKKQIEEFRWLKRICVDKPDWENIVKSEIYDISNNDIPYFYSVVGEKDIYNSKNEVCYSVNKSAIDLSEERIKKMGLEDLNLQLYFIESSMAGNDKIWRKKRRIINLDSRSDVCSFEEKIVDEAKSIAGKLIERAFRYKGQINWLYADISNSGAWMFDAHDAFLYDGLMGIAIFFSSLYKITYDVKYKKILEKLLCTIENYKVNRGERENKLSVFNGKMSLVYGYYFLGIQNKDLRMLKRAKGYLCDIINLPEEELEIDYVDGISGAIILLISIYRLEKNIEFLNIAKNFASILISMLCGYKGKFDREITVQKNIMTSGLAHGSSGVALALFQLYECTKDEKCYIMADKLLKKERGRYNVYLNNWIQQNDLKLIKKGYFDPVFWCHGATGIGLSRAKMLNGINDNNLKNDLDNAIRKVLKEGFGGSSCLCHGDFGSIDFLIYAKFIKEARQITMDLLEESKKIGWVSGTAQKNISASFMTGLSGVGYLLLRAAYPKMFPSVLMLEFPEE